MKYKLKILFAITLFGFICSCESGSEQILLDKIKIDNYDFSKIKKRRNYIGYESQNGIQYGKIYLKDNEEIKFWFLSHHSSSDRYGGTIYEYPNGEREFYLGFHCCEVQFYEDYEGSFREKYFSNVEEFKLYVKKHEEIAY